MTQQLLFLELNEVNFENVAFYSRLGFLPTLGELIEQNGWATTTSEERYEEIEPWIQWVTAHTGLSLAEHGVFRLGDIVDHDIPQIWERLEELGLSVGAISPMNAKHRLRNPAFFIPDPWTSTKLTASPVLCRLHAAISRAVNDNAQARVSIATLWNLLQGMLVYARTSNLAWYARLAATGLRFPWRRAILLDLLLSDVFIKETTRAQPHFVSLFLNAAAHIQHHYMCSAACYPGAQRNPEWYVPPGCDPLKEVYIAYDRILRAVREAFPTARVMIATGLHQEPHERVTFYWRLRRHADFLKRIRVPFVRVEPRMSRDFLVVCSTEAEAKEAERRLSAAVASDGIPLFEVDNRGASLFVMLTYPREIARGFAFTIGSESYADFDKEVVFVAIKNGQHNGVGYFLDTGSDFRGKNCRFPLKEMPQRIMHALGVRSVPDDATLSKPHLDVA